MNVRPLRLVALLAPLVPIPGAHTIAAAQATRPASQPASSIRNAPEARAPNPHWVADRCDTCHTMRGKETLPIPIDQVDRMCRACHDGRRAGAEKHPAGRPIPTSSTVLPQGWPAPGGRLGCATCHDLTMTYGHEHGSSSRSPANPDFLRVSTVPDPLALCSKCHVETARTARFNPHRMLKENGEINNQACLFCHTRTFKPDELQHRSGKPALKADVLTLCVGCHTRHIDWFDPGHFGAKATPQILAHLEEMNRAASMEAQAKRNRGPDGENSSLPIRLPLSDRNTVVCSTCHNPHEKGVFPPGSVHSIGSMPRFNGPHLVPTRLGPDLCGECHGK